MNRYLKAFLFTMIIAVSYFVLTSKSKYDDLITFKVKVTEVGESKIYNLVGSDGTIIPLSDQDSEIKVVSDHDSFIRIEKPNGSADTIYY